MNASRIRTRWAAIGAAVAVSLGAGGIGIGQATTSSGERPIYLPIEPCRLTDTRPEFQVGSRSTPLGADQTYDVVGWGSVGNCNLPNGSAGLALNVTAVGPTAPTFLTFFPAGVTRPVTSNLNPAPGQPPTPNAVNVDLDGSGRFSVYNLAGNVHVIIDVVGIYDDHTHDDRYYTEAEVDAALGDIDSDVTTLQSDVTGLESDVTTLQSDVTGLESDVADVQGALATGHAIGPLDEIAFATPANTAQIVAEITLPAGGHIVNASVVANNNDTAEVSFNCALTLGADTIAATSSDSIGLLLAPGLDPNVEPGSRESVGLTGGGTLVAPGAARLVCQADSTAGNWLGASMTAIEVSSVTRP